VLTLLLKLCLTTAMRRLCVIFLISLEWRKSPNCFIARHQANVPITGPEQFIFSGVTLSGMHRDILTTKQIDLLPLIREFSSDYYLVGGTAIALYLGHRRSIDFDLFTSATVNKQSIKRKIDRQSYPVDGILFEDSEQIHFVINSVKITFYSFPYKIDAVVDFDQIIKMPDLLTLSAMKAYAMGGRAKWKDYVDLYFILKERFSLWQISDQAKYLFGSYYNEKLLREQICYFQDIDYSESVDFASAVIQEDEIKSFLTDVATKPF
jgi:hypothetical protein